MTDYTPFIEVFMLVFLAGLGVGLMFAIIKTFLP